MRGRGPSLLGVDPRGSIRSVAGQASLHRGCLHAGEIQRRVHQRQVRERLRKIAQLAPQPRIVLLGEQPDIVAQRPQSLEQPSRIVPTTQQHVVVGEPETACEEGTLSRREPVVRVAGVVPEELAARMGVTGWP